MRSSPTDTLSLLKDLNSGVLSWVAYKAREAEDTRPPLESLDRGSGSCRDLAVLFAEAGHSLGFGTRIVSGYLHGPHLGLLGSGGSGSTHAWAEVYLPGAGWIPFDPANGSMGGANLIPVAVGRDIGQVIPVSGSFAGDVAAVEDMAVEVNVLAA